MAYFDQTRKAAMAPGIKAICKKYKISASLAVRNHSTVCLNIKQGAIDFISNCNQTTAKRPGGFRNGSPATTNMQVNPYHYQDNFDGRALKFLDEVFAVLNSGNHDRSDIQSDYFDVGWYVDVNIGQWNKPYMVA